MKENNVKFSKVCRQENAYLIHTLSVNENKPDETFNKKYKQLEETQFIAYL